MTLTGTIKKMKTKLDKPIIYQLPIDNNYINMNQHIGKYLQFTWLKKIICIGCGRQTNRSFSQGYCYPCFLNHPETSECIFRPELCQAQDGIARDMDWAKNHCLQSHFVYLAVSSGIKVGVTRETQIPARWIDQGASYAILFAKTPNRYIAGLIEVILKKHISDRTAWQRMLKNQILENVDLINKKNELSTLLSSELQNFLSLDNNIIQILYPVEKYPEKIKSSGFDKLIQIRGKLMGIKGQYLLFDDNSVLNIRKHNGYLIKLEY